VAEDFQFVSLLRGIGNHIFYFKNGSPCEQFALSGEEAQPYSNRIELNGIKSELTIHQATEQDILKIIRK